jgi:hypothetical protein
MRTLVRSHGHIPEPFLRAAGFSENGMNSTQRMDSISAEFPTCLLSYGRVGPYRRTMWPTSDFSDWRNRDVYQKALSRLLEDLRHEMNQRNSKAKPYSGDQR